MGAHGMEVHSHTQQVLSCPPSNCHTRPLGCHCMGVDGTWASHAGSDTGAVQALTQGQHRF